MRALAAIVGVIAVGAALAASQETASPVFKGGNRTVAVYATVTGADGRLVPDLKREAFSILDNGRRQDLTLFSSDLQPITVVMLLDRSGSMRGNFALVQKAAEEFVQVMRPDDKARIGSFSNGIQVDPRDFTSDREELLTILRTELQAEGPTPLWNAVNVGITALLHQQGRRVVLVFTDGMDSPMSSSNSNSSLKSVMKRAEEEDVMVYAIGLAPSMTRYRGGHGGQGGGGRARRRRWRWRISRWVRPGRIWPRRVPPAARTAGGRPSRRGAGEDCRRHRRRLLRADVHERSRGHVFARGRRTAPAVRNRLHARQTGRQDARDRGARRRRRDDGARP